MNTKLFNYQLQDDTIVFTDTLLENMPYFSNGPRDHESLFLVTSGNLLYTKGSHSQIVKEGQIGYIARGSTDKSAAYDCDSVSYIAVNFCFSKETLSPTLPFETVCSQGNVYKYENLFNLALHHFLSKTPGYMTICNGVLAQIVGLLYNEHVIAHSDFKKMQKIRESLEYLKQHYDNPGLQVSYLTEIAGLSEKQFRRIFLDIYKKTPHAFLQEFRINKAEILLLNTSKSVSEIACQCGFSDIYSFSHCFKKHTGVSPTQYKTKL